MLSRRRAILLPVTALVFELVTAAPRAVSGQSPDAAKLADARGHFERGVGLYKEADYRGALVEFRRAHDLAPNATVRFNLGQAQYQLRDYPAALATFEAYLAEAGPAATNRAGAQAAVAQLKSRVGTLRLAGPAGAEVFLEDELLGALPLAPLRVSVGSLKITLAAAGVPRTSQKVDVTGGATVDVTFADVTPTVAPVTPRPAMVAPPPEPPPPPSAPTSAVTPSVPWRTVAWVAAGVFAGGAITTGIVAKVSSNKLTDLKSSDGATRSDLDNYHRRMRTFAVTTDVLAGVTLVAAGTALYFTLSPTTSTAIHVGPTSLQLEGSF